MIIVARKVEVQASLFIVPSKTNCRQMVRTATIIQVVNHCAFIASAVLKESF